MNSNAYKKRIIVFFMMTFFVCSTCFSMLIAADNKFKDPLDYPARKLTKLTTRPLVDVCITGNSMVAVGSRGLIMHSENNGDTWKQSEVPVQSDLVAVHFPSKLSGWAVGHDGVILHSGDGGRSWLKQLDGRLAGKSFTNYYTERLGNADDFISKALDLVKINYQNGPAYPFLDIYFEDELTGYAVGTFGLFSKTIDGGKTWIPWMHMIDNLQQPMNLNDIEAINGAIYIASERGCIFRLNKQRDYFEKLNTGYQGTFFGITGNDRVLLAYGVKGVMYRSVDKGNSWEALPSTTKTTISAGFPLPSGNGFLFVTQMGEMLSCDGSANNFKVTKAGKPMFVVSAAMTPSGHLILTSVIQGIARQLLPESSFK